MTLRRASGDAIILEHLEALFDRARHLRYVAAALGRSIAPLTGDQCHVVACAVLELCRPTLEDFTLKTRAMLRELVDALGDLVNGTMHAAPAQRHTALASLRTAETALKDERTVAARTVAIRDEHDRLWLPVGAVRELARWPAWADLNADLAAIGWTRSRLTPHDPDEPRSTSSGRIRRSFYVEPEGDW